MLTAFNDIVLPNRLLLNLISSSAFESYFNLLVSIYGNKSLTDRLLIPDNYMSTFRPNHSIETDEVAGDIARDVGAKPHVQLAQEEEEEEVEVGDTSSFFRFLKTLVVHFTAKRSLGKQSLRMKDEDISISLFSVD